ncbi:MAG: DUF983 domain-containing protein [Rhizomicrobium sp.]
MIDDRLQLSPARNLRLAARRGLAGRCPACGKGRLFRSYLKPVDRCGSCGEDLSQIRADDGPAWLTILVVGHLVVALVLGVDSWAGWPLWQAMAFYPTLGLVLCLALLPVSKGLFIGVIWAGEPAPA